MSLDAEEKELVERAREAREAAYAPYSGFRVGAALEAEDGRVFCGSNVENAAYPVGMCAEHVALGAGVSGGARTFRRLALVVSGRSPASPCGKCRQALAEFGTTMDVISVGDDGEVRRWALGELLPDSFGLDDGRPGRSA